jgi:hypothetical protein
MVLFFFDQKKYCHFLDELAEAETHRTLSLSLSLSPLPLFNGLHTTAGLCDGWVCRLLQDLLFTGITIIHPFYL